MTQGGVMPIWGGNTSIIAAYGLGNSSFVPGLSGNLAAVNKFHQHAYLYKSNISFVTTSPETNPVDMVEFILEYKDDGKDGV